jgi:hypothetical protein
MTHEYTERDKCPVRLLKRRDRQVLGLEDFTDADLSALESAESPSVAATFDHELKS